jgi:DNA (cytosine-5)-methyltransferase 1
VKVAGLFAGIGGLEAGFAESGHDAALLCEVWAPARRVLLHRFPAVAVAPDVRELASLPGDVDLVTAGFPCQDLSQAGTTAGIDGDRSSLVSQVFRLLDDRPVPWVVLENVSFMLQLQKGRAMRRLVDAFEARGYRWAYRVVNTLAFLPQRRERVLFVATTTDVDPADVLFADAADPQVPATDLAARAHGFYWTEGIRGLGWAPDAIPTLKNGSTVGIPSPPAIMRPDGSVVTPAIEDAERLQGFSAGWTEPAAEVARASLRWSLVGNAVSVPVARWLGRRLAEPGVHDRARDRAFPARATWPRAARFDGTRGRAVEIGDCPAWQARPALTDFLRYDPKLLSVRATQGFHDRTLRSSLRFPEGFRERLRAHIEAMNELERTGQYPLRFPVAA